MSLHLFGAARDLRHRFDPPTPPFSREGKQRHLILAAPIAFVRLWVPRIAALVLLLGSATTAAETALPVSWGVEQIPDLGADGKGWGPAAQDGERPYRMVLKGPAAVMKLPNWWNDSVRPPKGACYVLEVTFKDVVDAPVSVKAFGGIGSYEDRTELHRIGGKNDGQWKVAQVPASWDLLMLRKAKLPADGIREIRLPFIRSPAIEEWRLHLQNVSSCGLARKAEFIATFQGMTLWAAPVRFRYKSCVCVS